MDAEFKRLIWHGHKILADSHYHFCITAGTAAVKLIIPCVIFVLFRRRPITAVVIRGLEISTSGSLKQTGTVIHAINVIELTDGRQVPATGIGRRNRAVPGCNLKCPILTIGCRAVYIGTLICFQQTDNGGIAVTVILIDIRPSSVNPSTLVNRIPQAPALSFASFNATT